MSTIKNNSEKITTVRPKESELSETTENYLKRILWLTEENGHAKVSDLANLMGRSLSSTTEAIKRLKDQGFANHEKYGQITLTERGNTIAHKINTAYKTIGSFLELIGIPKMVAHGDACSMEHSISSHTINQIEKFISFIQGDEVNKAVIKKFVVKYS